MSCAYFKIVHVKTRQTAMLPMPAAGARSRSEDSKWLRNLVLNALPPSARLGANRVMRSRDGKLLLLLLLALTLATGGVLWLHAGLEPERCDDEHAE